MTTVASRAPTDEQAALTAVEAAYSVWRECLRDLPACDTSTFEEALLEPQLTSDQQRIAGYQADGLLARNVDSLAYEVLRVDLEFSIPHVIVCEGDQTVLYTVSDSGEQHVVEAFDDRAVREVHLHRVADVWLVDAFATRGDETC